MSAGIRRALNQSGAGAGTNPFPIGDVLDKLPDPLLAIWTTRLQSTFTSTSAYHVNGPAAVDIGFAPGVGNFIGGQLLGHNLAAVDPASSIPVLIWYDQGTSANDLSGNGPRVCVLGVPIMDATTPVAEFVAGDNKFLSRADALGLAADPSLTIAWAQRLTGVYAAAEFLLALGTAATPELNLVSGFDGVNDFIALQNVAGDKGGRWVFAPGALANWTTCILKKTGTGYNSAAWSLSVNGVDQGAAQSLGVGALALGATLTKLGLDAAAAFPFVGNFPGLLLWDTVLSANDTLQVLGFLASQ